MTDTPRILHSDDFEVVARRIELLAKSTTARDLIKAEIQQAYERLLAERKTALSKHERSIEFAETVILTIAQEHPEWFADKKTLNTPFGAVHSHRSTSHKVPDEEHTIRLIKAAAARATDDLTKARLLGLIRVREEVNIEAVEALADKELTPFRIVRVRGTSLSIKLAKADAAAKKPRKAKTKEEAPDVAKAA